MEHTKAPPIKPVDLSIIIVTYNSVDFVSDCLFSVFASRGASFEVFLVDNASADGSAEVVRTRFPHVKVIANNENRGFGAANNQAIKDCNGRYIVFLNPDTTIEPCALSKMASWMERNPQVGLAGPKVFNADGTRQDSMSARYPGHRRGARDLGDLPGELAFVLGACQIVNAEFLLSIGGFDEDFFLYGEDQDLCLRIRKMGFAIGFIEDAVIMHHGGMSERNNPPAEVVRKKVQAEYLFYRKHYCPETVRQVGRTQRLRALWRIFTIRIFLPFSSKREVLLQKLSRYRVILEETNSSSK